MARIELSEIHTGKEWNARTNAPRLRFALGMTGGTIVSVPNEHGALEPAKNPQELLGYVPHLQDHADIEIFQIMNKDSTEIEPEDWIRMAEFVADNQYKYDGILFTHGTDTIAWSATAVRFILGRGLYIPVVFTGSQLSLVESRTDAITNIEDSIFTLIASRRQSVNEVMIAAARKVYRGVRSLKVSESDFDFIDSPAYPYLAKSTSNGIEFNLRADISHSSFRNTRASNDVILPKPYLHSHFDRNVLSLNLMPSYTEELLRNLLIGKDFISGVVFGSFGAGNTPKRLLPIIHGLSKENIPVIVTPQRTGFDTAVVYENARLAVEAGALQSRDMTFETASIKLSWLLASPRYQNSRQELRRTMLNNLHGEVSENDRRAR